MITIHPTAEVHPTGGSDLPPDPLCNMITIHPTAEVHPSAQIGDGTKIWNNAQVRENAKIGKGCVLGKDVYIDHDVVIGDYCHIQNYVSVYYGVTLEDGVFVGPHVVFINDKHPSVMNEDGSPNAKWMMTPTLICRGASIGAGAIIMCGVRIGRFAVVGAGSLVLRDVSNGIWATGVVKGIA